MSLFACKCGYKCVEEQLAKTNGNCPKCGNNKHTFNTKWKEVA